MVIGYLDPWGNFQSVGLLWEGCGLGLLDKA